MSSLKQTSPILLDASIEKEYQQEIKETIEKDSDNRISDIHVWKVGANHYAAIISLVTHYPNSSEHYRKLLNKFNKLSHVTIEVNECKEDPCIVPNSLHLLHARLPIAGTRITLYSIMDYIKAGCPPKLIRDRLNLTDKQISDSMIISVLTTKMCITAC